MPTADEFFALNVITGSKKEIEPPGFIRVGDFSDQVQTLISGEPPRVEPEIIMRAMKKPECKVFFLNRERA